MKSKMTFGLVVLTLAFAGCSDEMNGKGSNAGSSQPHVVNRPTDSGTMPNTNTDASGTTANPGVTGSNPATPGASSSNTNSGLPTTGSDATGTQPSTYAPSQRSLPAPDATDAGANAGGKAPTETTTPPNGR